MRKLILPIVVFVFIPLLIHGQVTCDKFEIKKTINKNKLTVWLDTDCPDFTKVTLTVSRAYWEEDEDAAYSIQYYQNVSTVGVLKNKQAITIDNKKWKSDLEAKQKEMAEIGLGFDVAKISEDIEVRAIVPLSQDNPKFGDSNSKLKGEAVPEGGSTINDEFHFKYPIKGGANESKYVGPRNLEVSEYYSISGKTPLMPRFDLNSDVSTLEDLRYLQGDEVIKVIDKKSKDGSPWYQVEVYNKNDKKLAQGWINSIALMNQTIKEQ